MRQAIEVENLTKRFGSLTAVDQLDLEIMEGEILGFLGPNGAGKTTSIRMMTGLLTPTSGRVIIKGEHIKTLSPEIKKTVGVCPQENVLWERLTCLENLIVIGDMYDVPRERSLEHATQLLQAMNLEKKRNTQARRLSGGMKKRLNLAMAFMHDPDILFLDEPITGLDPQTSLLVSDYIRSLSEDKRKTIILTTHLMQVADQLSDRVAIIDHGRLLVLDTPEQLKRKIGRGDVVEISLWDRSRNSAAMEIIKKMEGVEEVNEVRGSIVLRALDAVNMLPTIFYALKEAGHEIIDLSFRSNSLESVFISLTGRGLRE